ncbi:hypothetical protein BOX15_Mlig024336g1, partial [Macrostomum lignano]
PVPPRQPLLDSRRLDAQIKAVVHHLIPLVKAHAHETATPQFLTWLRDLALRRVRLIMAAQQSAAAATMARSADSDDEFERLFSRQLTSLVTDALAKYQGRRLTDCLEDLLVDLSETLFNELAFHRLIASLDEANRQGVDGSGVDYEAEETGDDEEEEEEEEEDYDEEEEVDEEEAEDQQDEEAEGGNVGVAVQLAASETREMTLIGSEEEEVEGGSVAAAGDDSDGGGEDTEGLTAVAAVIDAEEKDAQRLARSGLRSRLLRQSRLRLATAAAAAAMAESRHQLPTCAPRCWRRWSGPRTGLA